MRFTLDTRESADPHPWLAHFSADVTVDRGCLETGDLCLSQLPDGVVIERKAPGDFLACCGRERERFERELRRSRYVGRFVVIVEATLWQCLQGGAQGTSTGRGPGIHPSAVLGTVAAWTRRFCPILFAGDSASAARLAEALLKGQVKDLERQAKAIKGAGPPRRLSSPEVTGAVTS